MKCELNCYGDAAVTLPGSGVGADLETCRHSCMHDIEGCEAVTFGKGECYYKKDVHTAKCQPGNGDFVTEILTNWPRGTCIIMGDPHFLTFDNPLGHVEDNTQLEWGDYTIVKTDSLDVQGRFGYSDRFPWGASLVGLVVTGEMLQGHKLTVEYRGPQVGPSGFKTWFDDHVVLSDMDSEFHVPGIILSAKKALMDPDDVHRLARHSIGGAYGTGSELPSLFIKFPNGVEIYVVLGDQTMNAVITMRRPDGDVDGYCGNFNCVAEDDTMPELKKRDIIKPVEHSNFALPPVNTARPAGMKAKTVDDCSQEALEKADEICQNMTEGLKKGCIFDVCTSNSEEMGKEDVMAGVAQVEFKFLDFSGLHFPRLTSASMSPAFQWLIALAVMGLAGGGLAAGLSSRRALRGLAARGEARGNFLRISDEIDEEASLLSVPGERDFLIVAE